MSNKEYTLEKIKNIGEKIPYIIVNLIFYLLVITIGFGISAIFYYVEDGPMLAFLLFVFICAGIYEYIMTHYLMTH